MAFLRLPVGEHLYNLVYLSPEVAPLFVLLSKINYEIHFHFHQIFGNAFIYWCFKRWKCFVSLPLTSTFYNPFFHKIEKGLCHR